MSEWRQLQLGDVIRLKRGYDLPKRERKPGSVPIVSSSGITDTHCEARVPGPGVITGRYGTIGEVYFVAQDFWPLNTALYVEDFKGNDPRFISYFLKGIDFHTYSDKAAVPGVNRNHLHLATVLFPESIEEQQAIAGVLAAFDDKIELNRRMSETLEDIAATIFHYWFVAFDDAEQLAQSDLGLIPEGWRVEPIGNLIPVVGGSTPSTKEASYWDGGHIPWATPKDLSGHEGPVLLETARSITEAGLARISSGLLPIGSLLFSSRAPIGYRALAGQPTAVNQGFIAVPPGGDLSPAYMYFWAHMNLEVINGHAGGSTFAEISKRAFRSIPVVLPPVELRLRFDEVAGVLLRRCELLARESRTLAELRDTLLPKLISGELRITEGEQLVSEVA